MLCTLGPIGCRSTMQAGGDGPLPDYETIARQHNDRVGRTRRVAAHGSVRLTWTDEQGRHTEQGGLDLWLRLPDRTALNIEVEATGDRIMWLGSDASTAWLFDFRTSETTLQLVPIDAPDAGDGELPINPGAIFTLCGLTELPARAAAAVRWDDRRQAVVVDAETGSPDGTTRLYLDRVTLLPVGVEILAPDGTILQYSRIRLDRYARVQLEGRSPMAGPLFPTHVQMHTAEDEVGVMFSVYSPGDDVQDWYFDLDRLREKFRPVRVVGGSSVAVRTAEP